MSLQTITGKRVGDTYYKLEHPSGLTVFIYPKENKALISESVTHCHRSYHYRVAD